jgi:hypothetical protein
VNYEPVHSIWAVGRHQALAARAITHETICLAEIGYDYLGEFPETKPLLDPSTGIVYKDEARIICDGDKNSCRVTESRWADLPTVYAQKHGDCKCLVAIRLAELWRQGREAYPLARCYKCRVRSCRKCQRPIGGNQTWHMQLLHGDGRIEDISRWMGMPPHPDGDDAVVDAYDQVGIVRMRPTTHINGVADSAGADAQKIVPSPGVHMLPQWVLNHARAKIGVKQDREIDGICEPTDKNPNPNGGESRAGVATNIDYPWCVRVRGGDSARNIAERITGDRSRYVELVAANPDVPTATVDGMVDFAPGSLKIGARLKIPRSMKPWISQTGEPRGSKQPFPSSV